MSYRPQMPDPESRAHAIAPSLHARVWFAEEERAYRVRARDGRFAVCTKPFNPQHTVLYTVIDVREGVRGTENLIFGFGAETDEQCAAMLARIASGETEISHRNWCPLTIARVVEGSPTTPPTR